MSKRELQKKYNIHLLWALIGFFMFMGFLLAGSILMSEGNLLGILFLILSGISIIAIIIDIVYVVRKYNPLIRKAFAGELLSNINKIEGKSEFFAEDGKTIIFEEGYFTYNNIEYKYEDFLMAFSLKNQVKFMSNEIYLFLLISSDGKEIAIPLDGDLLLEVNNKNIDIINKEDLKFLLDNTEVSAKQLLRITAVQGYRGYMPLVFVKNSQERKIKKKVNRKIIVINVIIIAIIIAINLLFVWLGNTKNGIKISDTFAFNLGFKIFYSLGVLALALIKSKKIKIAGRLVLILYLLVYWITILFFSNRIYVLMNMIFAIIFIVLGVIVQDKENLKRNPVNRLIAFSLFQMLLLIYSSMDYEIIELGKIAAISGIITVVLTLSSIIFAISYYRRKINQEGVIKKKLIGNLIGITFSVLIMGFLMIYFSMQNLNYCLDYSEPKILEHKILELNKGGENESDKAVVMIDGKEVEIPISTSQYFGYKVGDTLEISLYSGFFGFEYYVAEEYYPIE